MSIKLDRFTVKDEVRGGAVRLATFSVNFGAMSVNGFELIKAGDKTFVSEPHNRYESPKGSNNWKRYSYVWFNDARGEQIKTEILKLAQDEYDRRSPSEQLASSSQGPFVEDDDLPF